MTRMRLLTTVRSFGQVWLAPCAAAFQPGVL